MLTATCSNLHFDSPPDSITDKSWLIQLYQGIEGKIQIPCKIQITTADKKSEPIEINMHKNATIFQLKHAIQRQTGYHFKEFELYIKTSISGKLLNNQHTLSYYGITAWTQLLLSKHKPSHHKLQSVLISNIKRKSVELHFELKISYNAYKQQEIIKQCIAECLGMSSEYIYFSNMDIKIDNICYGHIIGYMSTTTDVIDSLQTLFMQSVSTKKLQIKIEQHLSLTITNVVKVSINKLYEGKTGNNDMWQLDDIKEYVDTVDTVSISIKGLNGKTTIINDVDLDDIVLSIKLKYQQLKGIWFGAQQLIYSGVPLKDDKKLKDYDINNDSLLRVIYQMDKIYLNNIGLNGYLSSINMESMDCESYNIYKQFMISCDDKEQRITNKFLFMYKIEKNLKQNTMIYESLLSTKQNKTERMLFHGSSLENIMNIIHNGFNRDYTVRHKYGFGTYFARDIYYAASYSHELKKNSNRFAVLCCRTMIGDCRNGHCYMKQHELYKSDKKTQYDSLVDHVDDPSIFVINRDYQSIPCYLIVFSKHSI